MEAKATNPDEYQGWANRETWAAALHLSNTQVLAETGADLVRRTCSEAKDTARSLGIKPGDGMTQAGDAVAEWVAAMLSTYPDEAMLGMGRDIGSLWRVDWTAVARSLGDEA